jgi:hypothetical protein
MMEPTAEPRAGDFKDKAHDAWLNAAENAQGTLDESADFVRANPIPVVLGAFALGVLVAMLLPRRDLSVRQRYLEAPLEELKDLLGTVARKVERSTEEASGQASSAFECAVKKLRSLF